ncbi:MAG: hypothetical protein OES24_18245 [Acidimicrobiia bacterium]|nr:hypothetical protein [Acidimicrobiia bacterium]
MSLFPHLRSHLRFRGGAAFVALLLLLTACGGDGGSAGSSDESDQSSDSGADSADESTLACAGAGELDPADFVDPTLDTNTFQPLKPGTQWVRGGSTLVGGREVPYQVISTMSDVIRTIDGVPAIAMLDESEDAGEIAQVGIDYLALDKDGNVWLVGGYTEDYEGGEFTNSEDHWLGTADGATIGVLTPAEMTADTPFWCIGGDSEEDPSVGLPVETGVSDCVEFGCFDDIRIVQEGQAGAPDNEYKYYAPGVGVVRNIPLNASLHQDRFELLNLIELSPEGLIEVSERVLDLEDHAREVVPDVYGDTPVSKRAGG